MNTKFRENRILTMLEKGEVPIGMQVYTGNPSIVEILAYSGFDYIMIDMEHAPVNVETMYHCIRAAEASGITTLVRVAENNPALISEAVEAGAQGILVPQISNKKEVRKAISSLRYAPEGELGSCPSIRSAYYSAFGWDNYLDRHSNQTMMIPILEDEEAIENTEEIISELKPGVDAVAFGRADLAQSLTQPDQKVNWHHPFVSEAHERILAESKKSQIPFMGVPWPEVSIESAQKEIKKGADVFTYSIDQFVFQNLCKEIIGGLKGSKIHES